MSNGTVIPMMDESDPLEPQVRITSRLIDSLYTEAMLLADEARSYFADVGRNERAMLDPFARRPPRLVVGGGASGAVPAGVKLR